MTIAILLSALPALAKQVRWDVEYGFRRAEYFLDKSSLATTAMPSPEGGRHEKRPYESLKPGVGHFPS